MIAWTLYCLGFFFAYRVSVLLAEEDLAWYIHGITAIIWPLLVVGIMVESLTENEE